MMAANAVKALAVVQKEKELLLWHLQELKATLQYLTEQLRDLDNKVNVMKEEQQKFIITKTKKEKEKSRRGRPRLS